MWGREGLGAAWPQSQGQKEASGARWAGVLALSLGEPLFWKMSGASGGPQRWGGLRAREGYSIVPGSEDTLTSLDGSWL